MFRIEKNYIFFKLGQRKYMEDLLNKGDIFCNTFDYFANFDDADVGDPDETLSDLHYGKLVKLTLTDQSGIKRSFKMDVPGQLKQWHTGHVGNLYSLYAFKYSERLDSGEFILPEDLFKNYDTIVLILDIYEFLARIEKTLTEVERGYNKGFVKYLDYKIYSGDRSPFVKDVSFEHQHEYRIYLHPKIDEVQEPLKFSIGNITDIAVITSTKDFKLQFDTES